MGKRKTTPIQQAGVVERFAAALKTLRRTRGLTQKQLAEKADLTETYISRLEGGGVAPGIDLVARLAEALGASIRDLVPDAGPLDTRAVLLDRATELFTAATQDATEGTLVLLNQLLALVAEAAAKRS